MPLVDIHLIKSVFNHAQKQEMIRNVTDAMVGIEGEALRGVTWVRVYEVASGEWGIGGKAMTADDVKTLRRPKQPVRAFSVQTTRRTWTAAPSERFFKRSRPGSPLKMRREQSPGPVQPEWKHLKNNGLQPH